MFFPTSILNFNSSSLFSLSDSWLSNYIGFSFFATLGENTAIHQGLTLLVLGAIFETGRRFCTWFFDRFRIPISVTARFTESDPSFDWITLFLTDQKVWERSRDFLVSARNSKRKWAVSLSGKDNADYVPVYDIPQLFRWRGYWVEIQRSRSETGDPDRPYQGNANLTIYTRDIKVLGELIDEARDRYEKHNELKITVYEADTASYGSVFIWSSVKQKVRRPLSSIILPEGDFDSLIEDVNEFFETDSLYSGLGVPHRRGYLLYGPPGTGKSSTIYALAGELGLHIYSLSLASPFIDDSSLKRASSSIPKRSIMLIEDIDCVFPRSEDSDDEDFMQMMQYRIGDSSGTHVMRRKSRVSLSGLLNVLDGIGSEEGRIFIATTNHIERLDPALIRDGRIDVKMEYFLASEAQIIALFINFFNRPGCVRRSNVNSSDEIVKGGDQANDTIKKKAQKPVMEPIDLSLDELTKLANEFVSNVPEYTFTIAELQGFLLVCKIEPYRALETVASWVTTTLAEKGALEEKKEERKRKFKEKKKLMMKKMMVVGDLEDTLTLQESTVDVSNQNVQPVPVTTPHSTTQACAETDDSDSEDQ